MSKGKHSGNQVIIHFIVGIRVLGGVCALIGDWPLSLLEPPDIADIAKDPVGVLLGGGFSSSFYFLAFGL